MNLYADIKEDDRQSDNVLVRAGYLWGLALKLQEAGAVDETDVEMLFRSSRSLRAYAETLRRP